MQANNVPPEALAETIVMLTAAAAPEGLDAAAAAAYVGVSVSHWRSMDARGLCPAPVQVGDGRCPRWLRSELRSWLIRRCPARAQWVDMRDALMTK